MTSLLFADTGGRAGSLLSCCSSLCACGCCSATCEVFVVRGSTCLCVAVDGLGDEGLVAGELSQAAPQRDVFGCEVGGNHEEIEGLHVEGGGHIQDLKGGRFRKGASSKRAEERERPADAARRHSATLNSD